MVNYNTEVAKMYELIVAKDMGVYEAYRSELIKAYGYPVFRMILKQAYYKLNSVDYTLKAL